MELWSFLSTWGAAIGPALDFVGALLVFRGVFISHQRARELERIAPVVMIDDLGSPEIIERNDAFQAARAEERVRAVRWAAAESCSLAKMGVSSMSVSH